MKPKLEMQLLQATKEISEESQSKSKEQILTNTVSEIVGDQLPLDPILTSCIQAIAESPTTDSGSDANICAQLINSYEWSDNETKLIQQLLNHPATQSDFTTAMLTSLPQFRFEGNNPTNTQTTQGTKRKRVEF